MVDVVPGRHGPEILRILKRRVVEVQPLKRVVGFFGSDQSRSVSISTVRKELRSWTPQDALCFLGGGIVLLAYACFYLCFLLSPGTEGINK